MSFESFRRMKCLVDSYDRKFSGQFSVAKEALVKKAEADWKALYREYDLRYAPLYGKALKMEGGSRAFDFLYKEATDFASRSEYADAVYVLYRITSFIPPISGVYGSLVSRVDAAVDGIIRSSFEAKGPLETEKICRLVGMNPKKSETVRRAILATVDELERRKEYSRALDICVFWEYYKPANFYGFESPFEGKRSQDMFAKLNSM